MIKLRPLFYFLLFINVVFLIVCLNKTKNFFGRNLQQQRSSPFRTQYFENNNSLAQIISDEKDQVDQIHKNKENDSNEKLLELVAQTQKEKETIQSFSIQIIKKLKNQLGEANKKIKSLLERRDKVQHVLRWSNPFFLLGAYPKVDQEYFNSYPDGKPHYGKFNYGLINDPDYCEIVDFYNLAHPENMFETMNFFTDYAKNGLARKDVIQEIGEDTMKQISRYMDKDKFYSAQYHLNPTITNFFTKRVDIHIFHMLGKHFNCATQMYNHIPGHGVLKRKDLIVDSVNNYAKRFESQPHCFNKHKFFPFSYRLYLKDECEAFFTEINSIEYQEKLVQEPIQYLIKLGYGAHRAMGVFLLDANETENMKTVYENGQLCGIENKSRIAQTYIPNPLLLDLKNKFDFRVYMLVASTNPLIVYYHDGFLRVSLQQYDKHSDDKSVHLTNTHLSKDIFAEAKEKNMTFNNMTEQELRDYQMWTFEDLADYLLNTGKIKDPKWLDNYLRPSFYEAFIHIVRMSAHAFWNQSNVYELFGLDFMLDEDLNLWFIECNSSPQLIGTNEYKTKFLVKMLEDVFEIQYSYYRSRMKRALRLIKEMNNNPDREEQDGSFSWRKEYSKIAHNRFEQEYQLSANNSFKLIMDLNLNGTDAYFGHLKPECAAL